MIFFFFAKLFIKKKVFLRNCCANSLILFLIPIQFDRLIRLSKLWVLIRILSFRWGQSWHGDWGGKKDAYLAVSVLGENHFRKSFSPKPACLAVTENDFRLTNIFTFDPKMIFFPHFHFKAFPEKKRERERARARARGEETFQSVRRSPTDSELQAAPISSPTIAAKIAINGAISRRVDRDLAFARSRRREIAQLIAISPSTEIAINGATSQRVDSEIALARSRSQIAIVDDIFLGFVFSFFFSKHQKIFSGKFFEMQPNTWKYFPFPEISISGKYVFFGKRFTATKHSLRITNIFFTTYFTKTDDTKL